MSEIYIIAEAGVNHNGSLDHAVELVKVAADAGADAVKFQTFQADQLATENSMKAEYQVHQTDDSESQYQMLKKLELSENDHKVLIGVAKDNNIEFLSTPFDSKSLNLLVQKFELKKIKIPSGEITNWPFLLEISRSVEQIILSTGMSELSEVSDALSVIAFGFIDKSKRKPVLDDFQKAFSSEIGRIELKNRVTLLHATSEYPAPFKELNLNAILTLQEKFDLPVGYSDHTEGIHVPVAVAALGVSVIEKHFTLDKNLQGPDHRASLEPNELKQMIKNIRDIQVAMGNGEKVPGKSEIKNRDIVRKSLVASKTIYKGSIFTEENMTCKRPGTGLQPYLYWEILGMKSEKTYAKDEMIENSKNI